MDACLERCTTPSDDWLGGGAKYTPIPPGLSGYGVLLNPTWKETFGMKEEKFFAIGAEAVHLCLD